MKLEDVECPVLNKNSGEKTLVVLQKRDGGMEEVLTVSGCPLYIPGERTCRETGERCRYIPSILDLLSYL